MNRSLKIGGVVLCAAVIACAAQQATGNCEGAPPSGGHMAEEPGVMHKQFTSRAGEYAVVSRFIMDGKEPSEEKGTATVTSILGGRFISIDEKVAMFGQPFETFKLYGFNESTKRYEAVWMYTGSTAIMKLTGESTDGGKTIRYSGGYESGPGKTESFEIEWHDVAPDTFAVTMAHKGAGDSNGPKMEVRYTRLK